MSSIDKSSDNLQSSIESWITSIDSLSIYDLDRVLSPISKIKWDNINLNNLYTLNSSDNISNLIVERDLTTGQIIDYHENFTTKTVIKEDVEPFIDPESLGENDLLIHIPTLINGIDFAKEKQLNKTKQDLNNHIIEINLLNKFDNLNLTPVASTTNDDITKANDDETIKLDILNEDTDESKEFWSSKTDGQKNEEILTTAKNVKKWAVPADQKLVKEYERIKDNLCYQWKFELDVFQKQAVYLMENSECVFVAAHTSAGKTVVAEYAIALSFKHKTKVIYTSPIKALSNQKFREFKTIFEDVGLITGDIQISQEASCLIMTTEILRSMLYRRSETLRDLEWVIFDEVHYMNDAHRGVVWEEVLILLPEHINIVMLSATIPNHIEFAEWVGKIKQRNIYVMCTKKRPVPLEHFLYTGNSSKTCKERFLIYASNSESKFNTKNYGLAVEAKKNRAKSSSAAYGAKGTKQTVTPAQDKNIWLSLINELNSTSLLPAVVFIFSRKRCDDNINLLQSLDLNTQVEKSRIHTFINDSLSSLKRDDRNIPQIIHISESLKRGIGIHHSGILPIMKEIIELLFQEGLVKILFATETFAMGINMPARTVIFDSLRKHDGIQFRYLQTSEYIQMAGRAGRRGLDTTGTVIILCKNEVPDEKELKYMITNDALNLESKFRLTYSMILSLLRQKDMRIQDFMQRSFFEHKLNKQNKEDYEEAKSFLMNKKNINMANNSKSENNYCTYCTNEINDYYNHCRLYSSIKEELSLRIETNLMLHKTLQPGRILYIKGFNKTTYDVKLYPVLLLEPINNNKDGALVLSLDEFYLDTSSILKNRLLNNLYDNTKESQNLEKLIEKLKNFKITNIELPFIKSCLANFQHTRNSTILYIKLNNIEAITHKQIKLTQTMETITDICFNLKFNLDSSFDFESNLCIINESLNKNQLFNSLVLELFNYVDKLYDKNEFYEDLVDYTKDLNIRDIEFTSVYDEYKKCSAKLVKFKCIECSSFNEHFENAKVNLAIQERIDYLNDVISGNTLLLVDEYRYRIEVLKRLRLIDERNFVLLKGKVALEISVCELFLTELIIENLFSQMQPSEIVALLSAIVYQQKSNQDNDLKKTFNNVVLDEGREKMIEIAFKINRVQQECEVKLCDDDDYVEQLNFGLVEVVYEWSKGLPFTNIKTMTSEQEGIIVRTIQRLDEICGNIKDAARIIGDTVLSSKMEQCSVCIRRDIVFIGSLYTK